MRGCKNSKDVCNITNPIEIVRRAFSSGVNRVPFVVWHNAVGSKQNAKAALFLIALNSIMDCNVDWKRGLDVLFLRTKSSLFVEFMFCVWISSSLRHAAKRLDYVHLHICEGQIPSGVQGMSTLISLMSTFMDVWGTFMPRVAVGSETRRYWRKFVGRHWNPVSAKSLGNHEQFWAHSVITRAKFF
jgi:hypothetical protein